MDDRDRMITTDISANIVKGLVKRGWTIRRIARTIDAPIGFVEGVQAKKHVLTIRDIEPLATAVGTTANLMIFNSISPVKPHLRPLFDVVRRQLELSASPDAVARRKPSKKRRPRSKAA